MTLAPAGATPLALVEGALQLPSPLVTAVLLLDVLEDLLCGGQSRNTNITHTLEPRCLLNIAITLH